MARAFTDTHFEAILTTPLWILIALVEPGARHVQRRAVVVVRRAGPAVLGQFRRLIVLGASYVAMIVAIDVVSGLSGHRLSGTWVVLASFALFVPGAVVIARRPGAGAQLRRRETHGAQYVIDLLAARGGRQSALIAAAHYAAGVIPPEASVATRAASTSLLVAYRRYGCFKPVDPSDPLLLVRSAGFDS
ncbi:hypothetical protein IC607_00910 [Cellulomonas sp. JH27-2]|uniref:hypothetical protein n=1 Tax=Cellulomonas sp. JH27-2 TaxID=2774139 RepID=UPI00177E638E|nr:hypothetical protein [Cellulomonas sp. JH27-2]MBD8057528.1 hypothetical protein [Cellulomonas sp. JH27-2]